jgi:hypothetical protein
MTSGDWKFVLAPAAIFLVALLLAAIVDKLTGRNGR